jgi:precorrin-2/cobalt-factor-2 C20-methyltransferase
MSGRLIGVGTGPGDPELLTLKAVKALQAADVVAHFAKRGNGSNARAIVAAHLRPDAMELPLLYPVTTEIPKDDSAYKQAIEAFYEESARTIEAHLRAGRTVAVLSEGDPLFYGSYMHLHVRLADRYPTEVLAGITAMSGCWSAVGLPIAQGDDVLSVLPGTLAEAELERRLGGSEACVIMKVGRNLAKIRRALEASGRLRGAMFVERGTMEAMVAMRLADKPDDKAAYFSIVLVPGWKERP